MDGLDGAGDSSAAFEDYGTVGGATWVLVGVGEGTGVCVAVGAVVSVGGTGEGVSEGVGVGVIKGVKVSDGVKVSVGEAVSVTVPVGGRGVSLAGRGVRVIVAVGEGPGVRVGWLK